MFISPLSKTFIFILLILINPKYIEFILMHFSLRKMSNKFELLKKLINQAILKKKKKSLKFYLV